MDGFQVIDVAAPDDPYTPLARMKTGMMMGLLDVRASYTVFGGTSGAGPHVAAGVALIKQIEPELSTSQRFALIVNGADVEPFMGTLPNKEYGHGKLNIFKSYFGYEAPGNLPPTAEVVMEWRNGLYVTLDASSSSDPAAGALEARWDFEYDGVWDSPWMDVLNIEFGYPAAGQYTAKVAVRDGQGATDYAIVRFEALDDYDPDKKPPTGGDEDVVESSDVVVGGSDGGSTPFVFEEDAGNGGGGGGGGGGCNSGSGPARAGVFLLLALLVACGAAMRRRWSCKV